MHFHAPLNEMMNRKRILLSMILTMIMVGGTVVVDLVLQLEGIRKIVIYLIPFFIQLIISLFTKERISWLMGAIAGTIICMVCIVIGVFVFVK